jgi:hypothetical protein
MDNNVDGEEEALVMWAVTDRTSEGNKNMARRKRKNKGRSNVWKHTITTFTTDISYAFHLIRAKC